MEKRKLKLFNGRSHGSKYERHHVYIAASSMDNAAKLLSIACFGIDGLVPVSEIRVYYSKGAWGNKMDGIEYTEPCVYMCDERNPNNKPFRVV